MTNLEKAEKIYKEFIIHPQDVLLGLAPLGLTYKRGDDWDTEDIITILIRII